MMIGGASDRTPARVARWGIGFTQGGAGPQALGPMVEKVRKAWTEAGREGEPKIVALAYFALGPRAEEGAARYLTDYYAVLGESAQRVADAAPKTFDAIKDLARQFEDLGADELILDPTVPDPEQVDLLAEVVL